MDENKKQHEWILDGIDCANCFRHLCGNPLLCQLQIIKNYLDIRNNRELSAGGCLAGFYWIRNLHYDGKWHHSNPLGIIEKTIQSNIQ